MLEESSSFTNINSSTFNPNKILILFLPIVIRVSIVGVKSNDIPKNAVKIKEVLIISLISCLAPIVLSKLPRFINHCISPSILGYPKNISERLFNPFLISFLFVPITANCSNTGDINLKTILKYFAKVIKATRAFNILPTPYVFVRNFLGTIHERVKVPVNNNCPN